MRLSRGRKSQSAGSGPDRDRRLASNSPAPEGELPLTLGTAGHVDHGKTALIEALTGRNTDRLPEERHRGLSIELGFAELPLPGGRSLSVVDVPGHERFVRTMVAGASGIDLYLLVIAADDGVMPQTGEHLAVLRALGVRSGVVALTKCDLADAEQRRRAAREARELVGDAPLVEVSAKAREGLEELQAALAAATETLASRRRQEGDRPEGEDRWPEPAVLHADRVFTLRGIGTVVTGTLWSGAIERGQRVELLPRGILARVRGVQTHDRDVTRALAGRRVALNLARIERADVARGDVVASPASGLAASYRLDVRLHLDPGRGPLGGERVQVHHGTRDVAARVVALDEGGLAQLRLEAPLVARAGDRLVLRRLAPPDTLGGGEVIDPTPRRHGPGPATDRLRLVEAGSPEELLAAAVAEHRDGLPRSVEAWGQTPLAPALGRFTPSRWRAATEELLAGGKAVERQGKLCSKTEIAAAARRDEATSATPAPLGQMARDALALLEADGLEPRAPQAIADALGVRRLEAIEALEALVGGGKAVQVKPAIYYAGRELDRAKRAVVELLVERGSISLAELRDELGPSRKYTQALLEHLDSVRVTIRHGDRHVLRGRAAQARVD